MGPRVEHAPGMRRACAGEAGSSAASSIVGADVRIAPARLERQRARRSLGDLMHIDRSRFLLLTASISAGACSAGPPAPTGKVEVAAPPTIFVAEAPEEEDADEEPKETRATAAKDAGGEASPVVEVEIAMSGPCDATAGTPGKCDTLRAPGPQCESFSDTKEMCGRWQKGFTPKVAEKAVACLQSMSGKRDICDFQRPHRCALAALPSACADPGVSVACDTIMAGCTGAQYGNLTRPICHAALSAVTPTNRPRLATCMTEGCSADYCFWDIQ